MLQHSFPDCLTHELRDHRLDDFARESCPWPNAIVTNVASVRGAERLPLRIREDLLLIGQIFRYGSSMIETAGRDILDLWP